MSSRMLKDTSQKSSLQCPKQSISEEKDYAIHKESEKHILFIAYTLTSEEDQNFAKKLFSKLKERYDKIFLRDLMPGKLICSEFVKCLKESNTVIIIYSETFAQWGQCQYIIAQILDHKCRRHVKFLVMDDVAIPEISSYFSCYRVPDREKSWESLQILINNFFDDIATSDNLFENQRMILSGSDFFNSQLGIPYRTEQILRICGIHADQKGVIIDYTIVKEYSKNCDLITCCFDNNLCDVGDEFSLDIAKSDDVPLFFSDYVICLIRRISQLTIQSPKFRGQKLSFYPACAISGQNIGRKKREMLKNFIRDAIVEESIHENVQFPEMKDSSIRVKSLKDCPLSKMPSAEDMAKAGFFSSTELQANDAAQCFYCGGILTNWSPGRDPLRRHAYWFYNCLFVKGQMTKEEIEQCRQTLKISRPIYADKFKTFNERLASFEKVSFDNTISSKDLAEAGFFFAGLADAVACFQCGLMMSYETLADIDDPFTIHAWEEPECSFIKSLKGETFVRNVQKMGSLVHQENTKCRITFFIKFQQEKCKYKNVHVL